MAKLISEEEALSRLRYLCSKSEKCVQDLRDKLKSWNYNGNPEKIIDLLKEDNFIDEQRFCEAYVRDKIKFSGWGKIKVRYYLKSKRIPENLIDNVLKQISEVEYKDILIKELKKKSKSIKEHDKYKHKQKLLNFAAQRGYETDFIYNIVDKIVDLL